MDKIRSVFRRTKSPRPQETPIQNINAPSSSFNNVGGDQYNIGVAHIYPSTSRPPANPASALQSDQAPFNDAPIDNLSIHFAGRKRELALIAKAFERRRDFPLRCALHGNQGVGKSQLTYSWAKSTFAANENAYIMWISATTVEKLFQGFCRLLRFVNHPDQSHPDQNARLEAARRWLEEVDTGNWLLVFDNVSPETVDFLRQHLPRVNGRGTILFTTRTRDVAIAVTSAAGEQHETIEVALLDVKEGIELFCGHFESGKVDPLSAKVEAIVKAVGCLPLAISHAAAYMDQSRSSLDDLLELYQSKHKIDIISWEHTLSDYEHKSVAATFASQLRDLDGQHPDAGRLLRLIAFFDPESIPQELLTTGTQAILEEQQPPTRSSSISSPLSFNRFPHQRPTRSPLTASLLALIQSPVARQSAINHLQTRCLVMYHTASQSTTFRMHDLIQLVILENTKSSGLNLELFELAVDLACVAFRQIKNHFQPDWWSQCELLLPHLQSLTLQQDTSIKAKKALLLANHSRGLYLSGRGRYLEAEHLYENIIADREPLFGPNDPETLAVIRDLGWVCVQRDRYADAERSFKRVLKGYKALLGPHHRDTLKTMYYLAEVYHREGPSRHDDAEKLFKQTLQHQEAHFGLEDDDTLWTVKLLAEVYHSQDRHDEAESSLIRVLRAREGSLGSPHFDVLDAKPSVANVYLLYSLARVYSSQGRHRDAEKLLGRVLADSERIFGLSHPHTQNTITELASVYQKLGQSDQARILEQRISSSS